MKKFELDWISLCQSFVQDGLNPRCLNSSMAEFQMAAIIKLGENEWGLSQIELVWVRVGMEWECFWVNLRDDNKVSES